MKFEDLDDETRKWMLVEFEAEENNEPYRPTRLNDVGLRKFAEIMRRAIQTGDIQSMEAEISSDYLQSSELRTRNGKTFSAKVPDDAAHVIAHGEFTTWYTRGLARRLIEEGAKTCEIYRAETASDPRCDCSRLEGETVLVKRVYDGHRSLYYYTAPPKSIPIPNGPNCHHTIRRVRQQNLSQ